MTSSQTPPKVSKWVKDKTNICQSGTGNHKRMIKPSFNSQDQVTEVERQTQTLPIEACNTNPAKYEKATMNVSRKTKRPFVKDRSEIQQ